MKKKCGHVGSEVRTFNVKDMPRHIQTISQIYGHIQRVQSYSKVKTVLEEQEDFNGLLKSYKGHTENE